MKPWLYKTVGMKGWLIATDKAEFIETKAKLVEKLKELGLSGRQCCKLNRTKNSSKAKYHVEIKKNGITLFQISEVSEETMWALHDLANIFYSQDSSLFTELNVSKD